MINQIQVTTVFVNDQDKALEFYRNTLGMDVRIDTMMGENFRWLEVVPKGAITSIALLSPYPGAQVGLPTGMIFDTADVQAFYDAKKDSVNFTKSPEAQPWGGISAEFTDPDGNQFGIAQK
jgi:lactoylglutathione lyase